jgi:hypothetical protein
VPQFIGVERSASDAVAGITAPISAPQLDTQTPIDPVPYAKRAGLITGRAVTLVLNIEVLADGSSGHLSILNSSGDSLMASPLFACEKCR